MGGVIVPPTPTDPGDTGKLPAKPSVSREYGITAVMHNPPPPSGGVTRYSASIDTGPKSVAEVIYDATPVADVFGLIREFRDRRRRPALPPGLRDRLVLPPGMRQRVVAWQRGAVRRLPFKSNVPLPPGISRE
jgi:hypothetical protein